MPPPCRPEDGLHRLPQVVLVGVSGGVDSVSLLHALVATKREPVVVHFDHGWRPESGADADFVQDLATKGGLKFVSSKAGRNSGLAQEAAARKARYEFFAKTAKRLGVADLVLGHHADDQVETFLLQLFRGSGAAARGMEVLRRRGGIRVHRPWLSLWRHEIMAYARRNKLEWREDPTNSDPRHRRNLIRRRILPYLRRQFSPAVVQNLWRAAEIARAEGEWLDALCVEVAGRAELEVKALQKEPSGKQRRTVLRWLQGQGIQNIDFSDVEAVRGLMEKSLPAKINLSGGKFARRRNGKIFVE